jgi:hypothetical protein
MNRLRRTSSVTCARVRTVVSHCRTQKARRILTLSVPRSAASSEAAGPGPTSLTIAAFALALPNKRAMDRQRVRPHGDGAL